MTFGRVIARSCAILTLMAAALASAQPAPVTPASFDALLAAFARMPGLEARFVEEKRLGLLAKPLESRGRLFFAKPSYLLRKVEAPTPSEVRITADSLRVKNADGEQTLDLRSRPDLRPFVESLTWLLSGNRKALANVYGIAFEPGAVGAWRVTLTPKGEPISKLIQHIRIAGRGLAVSQIEVRETSGDETVTRIVEANPERRFDAAELRRLFGTSPAR